MRTYTCKLMDPGYFGLSFSLVVFILLVHLRLSVPSFFTPDSRRGLDTGDGKDRGIYGWHRPLSASSLRRDWCPP